MRVKLRRLLACCGLIALVCACATPRTQTVRISESALKEEAERQKDGAATAIVDEQRRLARVYRKLATKAHHFCGKELVPSTGASFFSASNSELSSAYARLFGITEKPTVLFFPGTYAHRLATGASLDLFGVPHDDKYYRAFNILHYEV